MNLLKKYTFFLVLGLQACGEMEIPDPVAPGSNGGLDVTINVNNQPYTALKNVGGSAIVTQQKVIVATIAAGSFIALSATCPSDEATFLTYVPGNREFRCSKDNAVYDESGKAKSGSGTLKKYFTTYSNNTGDIRIYE